MFFSSSNSQYSHLDLNPKTKLEVQLFHPSTQWLFIWNQEETVFLYFFSYYIQTEMTMLSQQALR